MMNFETALNQLFENAAEVEGHDDFNKRMDATDAIRANLEQVTPSIQVDTISIDASPAGQGVNPEFDTVTITFMRKPAEAEPETDG